MMRNDLDLFYKKALVHKNEHKCTAVPYQEGELLVSLAETRKPSTILEVGTGIGYSTACLGFGSKNADIHTIDKNRDHITLAKEFWGKLGIMDRITVFPGKAEDILPTLNRKYDVIFYDGHVPQKKLVRTFYGLLTQNAILVTANLFLVDASGGSYVRQLQDTRLWETEIIADTAISRKV